MAGLKETKSAEVNELFPALAVAALSNGAGGEAAELVKELVKDIMAERQAKKERQEKLRLQSVQATKEMMQAKSMEKQMCSHRNKLGKTRLGGQRLSGTNQVCLICTWCQKDFYSPAFEGQTPIPPDLMPSWDVIGG